MGDWLNNFNITTVTKEYIWVWLNVEQYCLWKINLPVIQLKITDVLIAAIVSKLFLKRNCFWNHLRPFWQPEFVVSIMDRVKEEGKCSPWFIIHRQSISKRSEFYWERFNYSMARLQRILWQDSTLMNNWMLLRIQYCRKHVN